VSAGLGFSITNLDLEADAVALLETIGRMAPDVVFHDVIGDEVARVRGRIERVATRPPHVGEMIGSFDRELFWLFEDHGDILVPGWPHEGTTLSIAGDERLVASVESMSAIVGEHLGDDDFIEDAEPETLAFLRDLRRWLDIAMIERVPLVAHW
jgi:hypothetical protein